MDQKFGNPAVDFSQAVVDQSTEMPTQRSTWVKKWNANIARSSASQPNFQPAGQTMAVVLDRIFQEIRVILEI